MDVPDKREDRLDATIAEIEVCLVDAAAIIAMGRKRFDDDWTIRRAAKNIVTEFAETMGRLPDRVQQDHPDIPWNDIRGMRNIVVHVYQRTDPTLVWDTLRGDLPTIGSELGINST